MLPACGDNTIIFNIQIAILGVVLVTAFFYLWRMISRMEERLERRISQLSSVPAANAAAEAFFSPADEDIMEQIFGQAAASPEEEPAAPQCEITPAEDEGSTTSLSRTKIRKMSVDALRDLCKEKGLSTEGSRSQLMERLFA